MTELFTLRLEGNTLSTSFGTSADNDAIVREVVQTIPTLHLPGGTLLKITGRMSLQVAFVLAHAVAHLYKAIAVWDPKLSHYVVCITHSPDFPIGKLVA